MATCSKVPIYVIGSLTDKSVSRTPVRFRQQSPPETIDIYSVGSLEQHSSKLKSKRKLKSKSKRKPGRPPRSKAEKSNWAVYNERCRELTERKPLYTLPYFHLRAWRGYHLDHIVSIHQGFKLGISPHCIASLENLRFIPWKRNTDKSNRSTPEGLILLQNWEF